MNSRFVVCALLALGSVGCGDSSSAEPPGRPATPGCVAPAGVSNAPRNIADTVTLLNALPKPLTLSCFLESLARPLGLRANNSLFSAQPGVGLRSPRIFVFEEQMVMSVVPAGTGAALLEFGEQRPDYRSLKAELTFPLLGQLATSTPFESPMANNDHGTSCAGCHAAEGIDPSVPEGHGFVSQALRPASSDRVSLASLVHENEICDRSLEAERCALLDGLFGWGSVIDQDFPIQMSTFGGNQ
ncbi:MAG: hypothetical protein ABW061_14375 [Polyangiaceae bacterium]